MFTKSVKGRLSTLVVGCIAAVMAASGQTNAGALQKAAVLARQHRFKEAMAEMKGVTPPVETPQRIAYFRLRAAVASGMGDASGAAEAMEEGLRLAPGDSSLRLATAAAQAALGDVSEKARAEPSGCTSLPARGETGSGSRGLPPGPGR